MLGVCRTCTLTPKGSGSSCRERSVTWHEKERRRSGRSTSIEPSSATSATVSGCTLADSATRNV